MRFPGAVIVSDFGVNSRAAANMTTVARILTSIDLKGHDDGSMRSSMGVIVSTSVSEGGSAVTDFDGSSEPLPIPIQQLVRV